MLYVPQPLFAVLAHGPPLHPARPVFSVHFARDPPPALRSPNLFSLFLWLLFGFSIASFTLLSHFSQFFIRHDPVNTLSRNAGYSRLRPPFGGRGGYRVVGERRFHIRVDSDSGSVAQGSGGLRYVGSQSQNYGRYTAPTSHRPHHPPIQPPTQSPFSSPVLL